MQYRTLIKMFIFAFLVCKSPTSFSQNCNAALVAAESEVNVLFFYTTAVKNNKGGSANVESWVGDMVDGFNERTAALTMQGNPPTPLASVGAIETSTLNFNSAFVEGTSQGSSGSITDSIVEDQRWFITSSEVSQHMNSFGADIAVLLVADNQKMPGDDRHGFAGLTSYSNHGYSCNFRGCGRYATIRDIYASANLTFDHEVGHLFALEHTDASIGHCGANSPNGPTTACSSYKPPMTIMGASPSPGSEICATSSFVLSKYCNRRVKAFASNATPYLLMISNIPVYRYLPHQGSSSVLHVLNSGLTCASRLHQ
ncbi:zinc-dependent metalloprotease family protein [Gilvimarinus agarilyticus]|uniref:zinc-dependent metalloprotease family protein n=1 Tax=Gilvimarinus agarilyticus TaxID=679259 RepID=UPI00059F7864|nr:zinc-dependent metalloprotease family protein [Gilvimarinus agarilyticus]